MTDATCNDWYSFRQKQLKFRFVKTEILHKALVNQIQLLNQSLIFSEILVDLRAHTFSAFWGDLCQLALKHLVSIRRLILLYTAIHFSLHYLLSYTTLLHYLLSQTTFLNHPHSQATLPHPSFSKIILLHLYFLRSPYSIVCFLRSLYCVFHFFRSPYCIICFFQVAPLHHSCSHHRQLKRVHEATL